MNTLKHFRTIGLFLLTIFAIDAAAQTGEIRGIVTDSLTGQPMEGVVVTLVDRGNPRSNVTDEKGYYSFKPLNPGTYSITYSVFGKQPIQRQGIEVSAEGLVFQDQQMVAGFTKETVVVRPGEYKPIDMRKDPGITTITAVDIIRNPTGRGPNDALISYAPTVKPVDRAGKQLSIGGSRPDATQYYVDGVKVIGELNIPQIAIEEVTMISGGLPAKYGDTTSGVVLITTKSFQ